MTPANENRSDNKSDSRWKLVTYVTPKHRYNLKECSLDYIYIYSMHISIIVWSASVLILDEWKEVSYIWQTLDTLHTKSNELFSYILFSSKWKSFRSTFFQIILNEKKMSVVRWNIETLNNRNQKYLMNTKIHILLFSLH